MMKLSKKSIFIILTILFVIVADQGSKFLVRSHVKPRTEVTLGERIPIVKDYFTLMNVENEGAFLGLGSDLNPTLKLVLLLVLPIVVIGAVLYYVFKDKTLDRWSVFAFSSIIGGGMANIYDRIVYGSVTDFLFIDLGGVFKTGVFNIADFFVSTGMVILLIVHFKNKN